MLQGRSASCSGLLYYIEKMSGTWFEVLHHLLVRRVPHERETITANYEDGGCVACHCLIGQMLWALSVIVCLASLILMTYNF